MDLLLSANMEVCRNSSWAVAVLAQSKTITKAVFSTKLAQNHFTEYHYSYIVVFFLNRGAETLQKLSEESPHRDVRDYGRLALKRLLSGSPAAKYNITNALSPQDVILESEFWDMGMAEAMGFKPLEKLLDQTANMNRFVKINFASKRLLL